MKNAVPGLIAAMLLLSSHNALPAAEPDANSVTPGRWTMDLEAAAKLAKEKKLPILLNFSGSDWCGVCKLMERDVFSQRKWKDYAKNNLVTVLIDFPEDASLVPQKYVKQNDDLKDKYEIESFPVFVLLDDDGETVLGRQGVRKNTTLESFIGELRALCRYRAVEVATYVQSLSPDDKEAYLRIVDQMAECRKSAKDQELQIAAAQKKIEELRKKADDLKDTAAEFRASKMDPAKFKQYKELKAKLDQAQKKLSDWMKTEPEHNQENEETYRAMVKEITGAANPLSEF